MSNMFGSWGQLLTSSGNNDASTLPLKGGKAEKRRRNFRRTAEDYALTELFLLQSLAIAIEDLLKLKPSNTSSFLQPLHELYEVVSVLLWHGLKHNGTAAGERNFWDLLNSAKFTDQNVIESVRVAAHQNKARTRHGKCRAWLLRLFRTKLLSIGIQEICKQTELVTENYEAWAFLRRQARAFSKSGNALVVTLLVMVENMTDRLDVDADLFDTSAPTVPGPSLQHKVTSLHRVFAKCLDTMKPPPQLIKKASTVLVSGVVSTTARTNVDSNGRYICASVDSSGRPMYVHKRSGFRLEYTSEGCWSILSPKGTVFFSARSTGNEAPRTGWSAVGDASPLPSQPVISRFRYANGFNALFDDRQDIDKVRAFSDEKAALEVDIARLKSLGRCVVDSTTEREEAASDGEQSVVLRNVNPAITLTKLHLRVESAAEDKVAKPIRIRGKKIRVKQSSSDGKRSHKSRRRPSRQHVEILEAVVSSGRKRVGSTTDEIRALAEAMISCSKGQQKSIMKEAAETAQPESTCLTHLGRDLDPYEMTYEDAAREAVVADILSDLVAEVIAAQCTGLPSYLEHTKPYDQPEESSPIVLVHQVEKKMTVNTETSAEMERHLEMAFAEAAEVTPLRLSPNVRPQPFKLTPKVQDKRSDWDEIDAGVSPSVDAIIEDSRLGAKDLDISAVEIDETILELVREYSRIEDFCGEHAKGIASAIKEVTGGYVCGPLLDDLNIESRPCWTVMEATITGYRVFEGENGRDSHVRYIIHSTAERVEARSASDTSLAWTATKSDEEQTKEYLVHRRYRDFQALVQQLQEKFPGTQLPALPKTGFTRRFGSEYLDKKKSGLADFLTNLLRVESSPSWTAGTLAQEELVLEFLSKPSPEYASFLTDDACKALAPRPNLSEGLHVSLVLEREEELTHALQEEIRELSTGCTACGISLGFGGEASFCHYLRTYFCEACFLGAGNEREERIIPSALLHDQNVERKEVCHLVAEYLDRVHDHPLVCPSSVNPDLFRGESVLVTARRLRLQLVLGREHLACHRKLCEIVLELGGAQRYLYQDTEMYSLADLEAAMTGTLIPLLEEAVKGMTSHVTGCSLCSANGFACEICDDHNLLYAHELDKVIECRKCKALYHRECLIRVTEEKCPQCLRRKDYS